MERDPHIHDLGRFQVDLRRAARPLDDDHVVLAAQNVQRIGYRFPEGGFQVEIVASAGRGQGTAHQHDLGMAVRFRFEQDRVHFHPGFNAGGLGLDRLGSADFAAIRRDVGVIRHVLRLERRNAQPILPEYATQRRYQHALADVGCRALHHYHSAGRGDVLCCHRSDFDSLNCLCIDPGITGIKPQFS